MVSVFKARYLNKKNELKGLKVYITGLIYKMSQIYTLLGDVEPLDEENDSGIFFRKELDVLDGDREKRIARIIKTNKLENIVQVYDIRDSYIDMELLDICENIEQGNMETDIRKAISQLNSVGIIYIDLKRDNLGYSHNDGKWKIFDFDASGIVDVGDDTVWVLEPPTYTMYNKYKSVTHPGGFKKLDSLILEEFLHNEEQQ